LTFGTWSHWSEHGTSGAVGAVKQDGQQEPVFNPADVTERSPGIVAEPRGGHEPHAPIETFRDAESHAATLAHELTHWTRHERRIRSQGAGGGAGHRVLLRRPRHHAGSPVRHCRLYRVMAHLKATSASSSAPRATRSAPPTTCIACSRGPLSIPGRRLPPHRWPPSLSGSPAMLLRLAALHAADAGPAAITLISRRFPDLSRLPCRFAAWQVTRSGRLAARVVDKQISPLDLPAGAEVVDALHNCAVPHEAVVRCLHASFQQGGVEH